MEIDGLFVMLIFLIPIMIAGVVTGTVLNEPLEKAALSAGLSFLIALFLAFLIPAFLSDYLSEKYYFDADKEFRLYIILVVAGDCLAAVIPILLFAFTL